jgi:CDP-diacylglycerol--glycerol-3-phosphate 3-phosphatidyltransferase
MKKNLNTANLITIFRIMLIPVFMVFYLNTNFYYEKLPLYAILVFLLAFFSDVIDGMIARSRNQITTLGKVLDPLADKLLRLSVLCAFMIKGVLPLYLFIILVVLDTIAIVTASILYFKKIVIPANIVGKITTIFMSLSLFSCFFHNSIKPVDFILVIISLVMVLITIIQYFVKFYLLYKSVGKKIEEK